MKTDCAALMLAACLPFYVHVVMKGKGSYGSCALCSKIERVSGFGETLCVEGGPFRFGGHVSMS